MDKHAKQNARKILTTFIKDKLFYYSGLRQGETMTLAQLGELVLILEESYLDKSWMTSSRLEQILIKGAQGHYGEFQNINKSVFLKWINAYYRENEKDLNTERFYSSKVSTYNEKEIEYWYQFGLDQFKSVYNQLLKQKEISYLDVPEDIDLGLVWWRIFEEAQLVSFHPEKEIQLIKTVKFKLDRISNAKSEFTVTVPGNIIENECKKVILRKEIANWVNQSINIENLFSQYKIAEIRRKNFFAVLV